MDAGNSVVKARGGGRALHGGGQGVRRMGTSVMVSAITRRGAQVIKHILKQKVKRAELLNFLVRRLSTSLGKT